MQQEHVKQLSKSLEDADVGELHPVIVDARTMEVLDGGDRVAAHHLLGHTRLEVSLRHNLTRRAREKIILSGNAIRRHEPGRQGKELLRLYDLHLAEEMAKEMEGRQEARALTPRLGRPLTPQGRAARAVAKQRGIKPNSVVQAVSRRERHLRRLKRIPLYEGELLQHEFFDSTYAIDTLGHLPPEEMEVKVAVLKKLFWHAVNNFSRAGRFLKEAVDTGFGVRKDHAAAWMRNAEQLRVELELLAPAIMCHECLGEGCQSCMERGWLDGLGGDHG